jgi:hypothetical protein
LSIMGRVYVSTQTLLDYLTRLNPHHWQEVPFSLDSEHEESLPLFDTAAVILASGTATATTTICGGVGCSRAFMGGQYRRRECFGT